MPDSRAEFTHRAIIVIGLVTVAGLLVAVLATAADVLLVLFGGILFSVFLRGTADLISEHSPLSPKLSLALVLAVLFALAVTGGWLLAGEIASQLDQLSVNLIRMWQQTEERLRQQPWGRQLLTLFARAQSEAPAAQMSARVTQAVSTTLGGIANFAIIVFVGMYLAINPGWYQRGLLRLFPPARRTRVREMLKAIGHTLRWWLLGRAVGMAIVGTLTTIGLFLLDVPLALALGVIAGAFDFVPFVGPIMAAAPGIMIASEGGGTQVMYVAMLYFGIQLLEGYVITPLIEQKSVSLPPALTISAQVLLGVLVGALGVVLATPLTAVMTVLVKGLYVEDTLEHGKAKDHVAVARRR